MTTRRVAALVALAAAAGLATAASPAAAADPVLPLSDVVPGMVGEARTVVRGTEIVTFTVTVIDVQRSTDGPGGSLVLVRASGPVIDASGGVAEGMSGSPVYVTGADGVARVMGAVAYGSGDQENVVVGVTPIEQMIDSSSGQRANEVAPRAGRRVTVVRDRSAATALERRSPDRVGVYPLARWTVAGASRPLIGPLSRELERSGIQLTSIGPRTPRPAVPLTPGASMTALLAGGDLTVGAVGTVTYVDGTTVLGFGHPFLGAGNARFLLGDGYVYQTIAAPIAGGSYKLAEPGTLHGMVIGDRADGVTGRIGPVEGITAVGTATDTGRGTQSTVRATIAPDERTAPIVGGLIQDEPAVRVRDGVGRGTLTLRVRITSPDLRRPITYRNVYASAGDVVTYASGQVPRLMAILMQNGVRPVPVRLGHGHRDPRAGGAGRAHHRCRDRSAHGAGRRPGHPRPARAAVAGVAPRGAGALPRASRARRCGPQRAACAAQRVRRVRPVPRRPQPEPRRLGGRRGPRPRGGRRRAVGGARARHQALAHRRRPAPRHRRPQRRRPHPRPGRRR